MGLGVVLIAWLIARGGLFAPRLAYLGYVVALLLILYLARLVVLDTRSLVLVVPAVLSGFLISPAWYVWLGLELWRGRS